MEARRNSSHERRLSTKPAAHADNRQKEPSLSLSPHHRKHCVFVVRDSPVNNHLGNTIFRTEALHNGFNGGLENSNNAALLRVQDIKKTQNVVFKTYIEAKREKAKAQKVETPNNTPDINFQNSDIRKHLHKQRLQLLVDKVIDRYIMNTEKSKTPRQHEPETDKQPENEKTKHNETISLAQRSNGINRGKGLASWTMEGKYSYTPVTNLDETLYGTALLKSDDNQTANEKSTTHSNRLIVSNGQRDSNDAILRDLHGLGHSNSPASAKHRLNEDIKISVNRIKMSANFPRVRKIEDATPRPASPGPYDCHDNMRRIVVTLPNILQDMDDRETILSDYLDMVQGNNENEIPEDDLKIPEPKRQPSAKLRIDQLRSESRLQSRCEPRIRSGVSHVTVVSASQVTLTQNDKPDIEFPQLVHESRDVAIKRVPQENGVASHADSVASSQNTNSSSLLSVPSKKHNPNPYLIAVNRSTTIPSIPELRSGKKALSVCGTNVSNAPSESSDTSGRVNSKPVVKAEGEINNNNMPNRLSVLVLNRKKARATAFNQRSKPCGHVKSKSSPTYSDVGANQQTVTSTDNMDPESELPNIHHNNTKTPTSQSDTCIEYTRGKAMLINEQIQSGENLPIYFRFIVLCLDISHQDV